MAKVLRFDGLWPGYEEWVAQETARQEAVWRAESVFAVCELVWSNGRGWHGEAKFGVGGPYAWYVRRVPGVERDAVRYIPRESSRRKAHVEQPRTTAEAVAALRAEEAREVASYGEPDVGRRSVSVRDGDPEKAEQLMAHVCRIEARLKTELRFAERFLLLRLVWAPFCGWRLRRVMRTDWAA